MSEPSDWLQIVITVKTRCIICGKEVPPGPAHWSKATKASKHLTCTQNPNTISPAAEPTTPQSRTPTNIPLSDPVRIDELNCYICGSKTGCNECSLLEDCNTRAESKYCICENCAYRSQHMTEAYQAYQKAFEQRMNRSSF